jgi:hypothetical protein
VVERARDSGIEAPRAKMAAQNSVTASLKDATRLRSTLRISPDVTGEANATAFRKASLHRF